MTFTPTRIGNVHWLVVLWGTRATRLDVNSTLRTLAMTGMCAVRNSIHQRFYSFTKLPQPIRICVMNILFTQWVLSFSIGRGGLVSRFDKIQIWCLNDARAWRTDITSPCDTFRISYWRFDALQASSTRACCLSMSVASFQTWLCDFSILPSPLPIGCL